MVRLLSFQTVVTLLNKLKATPNSQICAGDWNRGGPFSMVNIFDFVSLPCNRLLTNMITWTVVRNAQHFRYDFLPEQLSPGGWAAEAPDSCPPTGKDAHGNWLCVRSDDGQPPKSQGHQDGIVEVLVNLVKHGISKFLEFISFGAIKLGW